MSFRIIIAGSRDFNDYELVKNELNHLLQNIKDIEVVSGCARGVDKLGEKWARENNYPIKKFPANWSKYGKKAGPIRNEEMACYADACIVFRHLYSRGSTDMFERATNHGLKRKMYDV